MIGRIRMPEGGKPPRNATFGRLTLAVCLMLPQAAHATSWSSSVTAVYKLRMAGMELATFNFNSAVNGSAYKLAGHGKLTWGFGLYSYTGNFQGAGTLAGDDVRPATYVYDWKVNRKSGGVKLAFARGGVQSVEIQPPHTPSPEAVPVRPEQLKSVFDPLTALIVLSRQRGGDPCERRIGLFEGKQRFDLVLTRKREEKVVEAKPSGQPATAHVCAVRYVPVSGHRPNRETKFAIGTDGIEVAFRPVPSASLLIPYRITIPTPIGNAVLLAQRIDITAPGNRQIALSH
jgi:hypothetical protein